MSINAHIDMLDKKLAKMLPPPDIGINANFNRPVTMGRSNFHGDNCAQSMGEVEQTT